MASKTIDYSGFKQAVAAGKLKRLLLLTGEEEFFIENGIKILKKTFLSPGSEQMDFVKLDLEGKHFDKDRILDNVMLPPWMSPKRLVLVKDSGIFTLADPKKEISDAFEEIVKKIPESTLLIFVEDKVDKRKKAVMGLFEKEGLVCEFNKLSEGEIAGSLEANLKKQQMIITEEASESLISRCDGSMRAISSEYNKLALYCGAKGLKVIDMETVELLCQPDLRGSVFNMLDAISAGDCGKALCVLDELISKKEPVTMIKFMFTKHIMQLICAKELKTKDKIRDAFKIHPFSAQKLAAQAPHFSMEKLLNLFSACNKSDYEARMGKLDERQALEILLVLACKSVT